MCAEHCVSLGFTDEKVPAGTHICLIFTDERERVDALLKFLLSGLQSGERMACFSERIEEKTVREYLAKHGISYDECRERDAITLAGTSSVYFKDGVFDPDRMLKTLSQFYRDSLRQGFTASRVIGEMTPDVERVPGGERLMEYECRVTKLVRETPVTSVCQYDATQFDGATIMNVLKVHPKMIVNGAVVQNPFFIEPEEYLKGL
ncbi:MAG TPA: MEDS domain-containing protein [Candidatus Ozemobacteraceae bacterium]|nr:MEDS domain-containing protein [Candidatus Ozemobacteraceae bacterium]